MDTCCFLHLISAAERICFYRWVIVMDTCLSTGSITHYCHQFHAILMMIKSWCEDNVILQPPWWGQCNWRSEPSEDVSKAELTDGHKTILQ